MSKIKFSIITPTYNRRASGYLLKNIEAVQQQEKGNYTYEHIIVDDGSSDGTKEMVEEIQKKDSNIKYIYQKNSGAAKATQKGIENISGNYTIILDDDDYLSEDSLRLRSEFIEKNPKIDWFYGLAEWVDDYNLPTPALHQSKFFEDKLYERMLINNLVNAGTPTISTKALKSVEWPDWIDRSQDYFLWLELARPERNYKIGFIDKVVVVYRNHTQSYTAAIDSKEKLLKKAELNFRIKDLHPGSQAFFAKEAYFWKEEAHRTADYFRNQLREMDKLLEFNRNLVKTYQNSRVIGRVIKLGNKLYRLKAKMLSARQYLRTKASIAYNTIKFAKRPETVVIENTPIDENQPLVSVITPFYNRAETMPETIRSVLSQTLQDFEYIIVDDGSTEKASIDYLKKVSHPKIDIYHQPNKGVAAARNFGISKSSGRYIVCLDSDDILEPTYLEKAVAVLETQPDVGIVTFDTQMFGERDEKFLYFKFRPFRMTEENQIITAAVFRKEAWESTDGFKDKIGYEDWEFWTNLVEHGFFAKHIPESIFHYRTASASRFIEDSRQHHENSSKIKRLHPNFEKNVKNSVSSKALRKLTTSTDSAFLNINDASHYINAKNNKPNILLILPWLTVGGAETLILNFAEEIRDRFNFSIITGVESNNEWEDRFKKITPYIYHLPHLFEDRAIADRFILNYLQTRDIDIVHIVHNSVAFDLLPEIKQKNPNTKVITTIFNDRAHFDESIEVSRYVDLYSTDNEYVRDKYLRLLKSRKDKVEVIPNGIDTEVKFNPSNYDRETYRKVLGLKEDEIAVMFIGRLSEEKNPDKFIDAAVKIISNNKITKLKFFVTGEGPMRKEISKVVNKTADERLRYLGYRVDIPELLCASDIFVLPSSTEGFPLSLVEAMSMEVVPIASSVGAVSKIITDKKSGLLIRPGSVNDIISSLEYLGSDIARLERMKNESRRAVESKYSKKVLGDNYKSLYGKVLK